MGRSPHCRQLYKDLRYGLDIVYTIKNLIYHSFKDNQGFYHLKFVRYDVIFFANVRLVTRKGFLPYRRTDTGILEKYFPNRLTSFIKLTYMVNSQILEIYQIALGKIEEYRKSVKPNISSRIPNMYGNTTNIHILQNEVDSLSYNNPYVYRWYDSLFKKKV